ncbi:alpha/beta-hydrolase [Fomes fomentarius]|nr:alpha/beta-hydrolase [Fomes fomentarius]
MAPANAPRPQARRDTVELPSGTTLEYTLIQQTELTISTNGEEEGRSVKLAICLHPWSWLGGRMDDPVLELLTESLLARGYDVLRYNSRGVGKSTGWASFTGSREAEDLKELVEWARNTVSQLNSLVLAGYSYGSLIASLHPVLHDVPTAHILLSYPIGPRHWLTAFHGHLYTAALQSLIRDPRSNVLVIYGDEDNFTSAAAYDAWAATLQRLTDDDEHQNTSSTAGASRASNASDHGKLEIAKVRGASHFWREEEAVHRLLDVVQTWLP